MNVVNYLCIFSPSLEQIIVSILYIQKWTKVLLEFRKFFRFTQRKFNIILKDVLMCKLFKWASYILWHVCIVHCVVTAWQTCFSGKTDMHVTIKDIIRNSVFYKRFVLRLYNQARQAVDGQWEPGIVSNTGWEPVSRQSWHGSQQLEAWVSCMTVTRW
jgi:hypothetical protein